MSGTPRIRVDLIATQDRQHAERGIAAYARALALAIERLEPHAVDAWVLDPALPAPTGLAALEATARVVPRDQLGPEPTDVWHVLSPFDGRLDPLRIVHPENAPLVVTLYDLIPLVFDDQYLRLPSARARYLTHVETVRRADHVLCISRATADDAIRLLGLDPARVSVAGIAIDPLFTAPLPAAEESWAEASAGVPGLRPGFVMYTGGSDSRKNIAALISAYAALPAELRSEHQLVVVCRLDGSTLNHYRVLAAELGAGDDVLFTGYVENGVLASLYRSTELFVFPSLYEGFGLPVAEALACGAPVVVGDNSSLVELVPLPEARFDAADEGEITAAIRRGLEDDELRARVRELGGAVGSDWEPIARRTVDAYRAVAAEEAVSLREEDRPSRVAVVCVAELLSAAERERAVALLESHPDAEVFGRNADPRLRATAPVHALGALTVAEAVGGRFDRILFVEGDRPQPEAARLRARLGRGETVNVGADPAPPA